MPDLLAVLQVALTAAFDTGDAKPSTFRGRPYALGTLDSPGTAS